MIRAFRSYAYIPTRLKNGGFVFRKPIYCEYQAHNTTFAAGYRRSFNYYSEEEFMLMVLTGEAEEYEILHANARAVMILLDIMPTIMIAGIIGLIALSRFAA